jgi:hypothetical protein
LKRFEAPKHNYQRGPEMDVTDKQYEITGRATGREGHPSGGPGYGGLLKRLFANT